MTAFESIFPDMLVSRRNTPTLENGLDKRVGVARTVDSLFYKTLIPDLNHVLHLNSAKLLRIAD
jgi:hypothetical protein